MKRLFRFFSLGTLGIFLSGYAVLLVLLWAFQVSLIFHPTRDVPRVPSSPDMSITASNVTDSDHFKINTWTLTPKIGHPRAWVLLCHGNGGDLRQNLPTAEMFVHLGLGVRIFDYRGYGQSEGVIQKEADLINDAQVIYNEIAKEGTPIVIYGHSFGGAVAAQIAAHNPCACLILSSTFTSFTDRAADDYPFVPISWLARFRFDTLGVVRKLKCPKLIMHGPDDRIVAYYHGQRIFEAAAEPKEWLELAGGHNDPNIDRVEPAVRRLLERSLPPIAASSNPTR